MENRAHALLAGLFVLFMGAATALAVWWFSDEREATTDYELVTTGSISGLNPQAQVRFRGMAAGKVMGLRIDPQYRRNILVWIRIRADLPITMGTRASLGYQGVTGLAFVDLDDRGADPRPLSAAPGQLPRIRLDPGLLDRVSDTVMDALDRFKGVADQIGGFFDEQNLARFRATLERLESATVGLDETFSEAPRTLESIRSLFGPENQARWSALLSNLEQVSGDAVPAVAEMRLLMQNLQTTMRRVDAAAGAASDGLIDETLPQLNDLLRELNDVAAKMGRLIDEVESSPQMLITGRGQRRPGPGERGFETVQ
ncbi:MAG: MlaD family protein [Rhodocyclaceae bacterium]